MQWVKQVDLSMVSGHPSIRSGPGENQPEEGRISFELELSAFLVLRPSDLETFRPSGIVPISSQVLTSSARTTSPPGSPACRSYVLGLLSLHTHMNQYLISLWPHSHTLYQLGCYRAPHNTCTGVAARVRISQTRKNVSIRFLSPNTQGQLSCYWWGFFASWINKGWLEARQEIQASLYCCTAGSEKKQEVPWLAHSLRGLSWFLT